MVRRVLHEAIPSWAPPARPMTGSHVFTTRTDRHVLILSFVISAFIVLTIAAIAFGALGPVELLLGLVIAIPLTFVVNRPLRTAFARRSRPA